MRYGLYTLWWIMNVFWWFEAVVYTGRGIQKPFCGGSQHRTWYKKSCLAFTKTWMRHGKTFYTTIQSKATFQYLELLKECIVANTHGTKVLTAYTFFQECHLSYKVTCFLLIILTALFLGLLYNIVFLEWTNPVYTSIASPSFLAHCHSNKKLFFIFFFCSPSAGFHEA